MLFCEEKSNTSRVSPLRFPSTLSLYASAVFSEDIPSELCMEDVRSPFYSFSLKNEDQKPSSDIDNMYNISNKQVLIPYTISI
jgi:hypothetical protein